MLAYPRILEIAPSMSGSYLYYERKVMCVPNPQALQLAVSSSVNTTKNLSNIKIKLNLHQLTIDGNIPIEGLIFHSKNLYMNDEAVREAKRTTAYNDDVRDFMNKYFYVADVQIGEDHFKVEVIFYSIESQFMLPSILTGSPALANIVQRHIHIYNNFYSSDNDAQSAKLDNFNKIIEKTQIYDLSTHIGRGDPASIRMNTNLWDYQINDVNMMIKGYLNPLYEIFTNDKIWMCDNGLIYNYSQSKFVEFDELRGIPIKGIVLSNQPGTGKSLIVLTFCHLHLSEDNTAIVVPDHLYVSGHWDMEIRKHFIAVDKMLSHIHIFSFTQFSVLPPSKYNTFDSIFIDEAHEVYTPGEDTPVTKTMKERLFRILTSTSCRYKCLITGTPFSAGVDSMYHIIKMLTDQVFHYIPFIRNCIYEPTLAKLFYRNTLENVNRELNLPPCKFQNVFLKLTPFEQDILDSLLEANNSNAIVDPTKKYSNHVNVEQIRKILSNVMTAVLHDDCSDKGYINLTVEQVKELFLDQTKREYSEQTHLLEKLLQQLHYLHLIKSEIISHIERGLPINMGGIMAMMRCNGTFDSAIYERSVSAPHSSREIRDRHSHVELQDIEHNISHFTDLVRTKERDVESKKAVFERYSKIYSVIEEATARGSDNDADTNFDDDIDYDSACQICMSPVSNQIAVFECGHFFCKICSDNLRKDGNELCPSCRRRIPNDKVTIVNHIKSDNFYGTKFNYIVEMLHHSQEEQFIIFTQFDRNIKSLSAVLNREGISNVIYQDIGNIIDFRDNHKRVIILSSVNQPSGLDLSFAANIIILEPPNGEFSFRRDIERQIIGRILRINQSKPVTVTRLIITNSIEEQLYVDL